jgi:pimeloyl-ACP methyl ester carboxylesterase
MKLAFKENGRGIPLVLLHGYLEQKEMWAEVIKAAPVGIRIICPDLPGHGSSAVQDNQTIGSMAAAVAELLDSLKIDRFYLAGHSMGGYVALALAEMFPARISKLALLHSHPFADPPEKSENRLREIKLIEEGKKDYIIRMAIPNLFANEYAAMHPGDVQQVIEKAMTTTPEGMAACLRAMAQRPDRSHVLTQAGIPVMLLLGKHDNLIGWEKMRDEFVQPHIRFETLEKAGHMGMIEEKEIFCSHLYKFFCNDA